MPKQMIWASDNTVFILLESSFYLVGLNTVKQISFENNDIGLK